MTGSFSGIRTFGGYGQVKMPYDDWLRRDAQRIGSRPSLNTAHCPGPSIIRMSLSR